jgi:hypothetical protein
MSNVRSRKSAHRLYLAIDRKGGRARFVSRPYSVARAVADHHCRALVEAGLLAPPVDDG